jgi:methylenetetrahydrofolate dehydrogenase (NADP+)/methenyltetrahydrofolate cyclohydrolase
MVIDGKEISARLLAELKPKLVPIAQEKFFGAALVGDNAASTYFLKQKEKAAQELGVEFRLYPLPADITTDALRQEIGRLAGAKTCGGFIVQLPLPEYLQNKHYILNAIPKEKDVDLLGEHALGAFYTERSAIVPPSVGTVHELLKGLHQDDLREKTVAVIGTGFLIGRPVGFSLQNRVAELMVFDSMSKNLHERLNEADIVISGAGVPKLFSAKHLRDNAFVIDFGYGRGPDGKVSGDFDPEGSEQSAVGSKQITYTKTPGGTGPILVAKLFENFYILNRLP